MTAKAADRQDQKGRALRPFFALALVAAVLGCSASDARVAGGRSAGRLLPPATLGCDRNHLTSWSGVVSGYRREAARTWLQVSTDEDTVEQTSIEHPGQPNASAHYLLWGAPFTALDWPKIERATGVLIDGTRAVVWVCDDGKTAPVVDWQPRRDSETPQSAPANPNATAALAR